MHLCVLLGRKILPNSTVLIRFTQWGMDMSQISGRLDGSGFEPIQVWNTTTERTVPAAPAAAGLDGRRYHRRLVATDSLIITLAGIAPALIFALRVENPATPYTLQLAITGLAVTLAWLLIMALFKTRAMGCIAVGMQEYKYVVYATASLAGVLGVLGLMTPVPNLRVFVTAALPAGLAALLAARWCWRQWLHAQRERGFALSNVLVYGQATDAPHVVHHISKRTGPAYRVVGVLVDGDCDAEAEADLRSVDPTLPLLNEAAGIEEQLRSLGADSVVVAGPLRGGNDALQELSWRLERIGVALIVVSALTNVASRRVRTSPVDGLPLLHVDLAKFTGWRYALKRSMDIAFAAAALLALSPVFLVIAGLIRLDGPGPVFFKQERAGQDGTPFFMFKFRTMVPNAEQVLAQLEEHNEGAGPLFKLKDDPRVTRIGRLLRKHSLDELPQFLNVLRGDMSVVGPRPPLFKEVAAYEGHTHRRLYLKPGVTGLWQVSGRSNLSWKESVRLDLYYVENWTALSDLRIIWRTVRVMIKPDGAF